MTNRPPPVVVYLPPFDRTEQRLIGGAVVFGCLVPLLLVLLAGILIPISMAIERSRTKPTPPTKKVIYARPAPPPPKVRENWKGRPPKFDPENDPLGIPRRRSP